MVRIKSNTNYLEKQTHRTTNYGNYIKLRLSGKEKQIIGEVWRRLMSVRHWPRAGKEALPGGAPAPLHMRPEWGGTPSRGGALTAALHLGWFFETANSMKYLGVFHSVSVPLRTSGYFWHSAWGASCRGTAGEGLQLGYYLHSSWKSVGARLAETKQGVLNSWWGHLMTHTSIKFQIFFKTRLSPYMDIKYFYPSLYFLTQPLPIL